MQTGASANIGKLARPTIATLLVGGGLAHLLYHTTYTLDDAYIGFRYSRNLAGC